MKVNFISSIKGGLPVEVEAEILPPEPDVGFTDYYVGEITVKFRSGHPFPQDKIPTRDYDKLIDEAYDIYMGDKEMATAVSRHGEDAYRYI